MHIIEGKAALWLAILGLAGMGALEVFPDRAYIGWAIISVAGFGGYVLICYHASEAFDLTWKSGLRSKMVAVFGMLGCIIGFLIFASIFLLTFHYPTTTVSANDMKDIKSKLDIIRSDFDEYVRPRSLTEEHTKKLTEYLLPREHFLIYIQYRDEDQEAKAYAEQFYSPFRESGLDARMRPVEPDGKLITVGTLSPGLTINYRL